MRLVTAMPINLKDTDVTMTTPICRIGVKFKRCKPMTQEHLTRGITTTSLLFPLGLSIQLAILHRFYPQPVPHIRHGRELPLPCASTCSLCASVKWRRKSWGGWREGIAVAGPPSLQPPPPGTTATTSIIVGFVSIRNDENSADLTKSFQELSRLPVLVNSGYLSGSFSLLVRAGFSLPDYLEKESRFFSAFSFFFF